jgi:DNA-binding CsgD family transcriptional regulator
VSGTTQLPLAERERELRALAALVDAAAAGEGGVLVVEGPAGIGKTRLLDAAVDLAGEREVRCLRARASGLERDYPFGVVRQIFESALHGVSATARKRLFAGAARLAETVVSPEGQADAPPSGADPGYAILHGLYWLVSALAQSGPLLLVVDDAHWADAQSWRFTAFLTPRLEGLPVSLLLTARPAEGSSSPLAELLADPRVDIVRPSPLSPEAVAAAIEAALATAPDPAFAAACHRATGGNPFFFHALLRELAAAGTAPVAASAAAVEGIGPAAVSAAVLSRLARLGEHCKGLATAAAVLGDGAALRHARALAALEEREAVEAADALTAAGILEPTQLLSFAHPIVRAAVYEDIPVHRRASLHRQAAERLAADAAEAPKIAVHLMVSEPRGDAQTVEILRTAAAEARSRGAADTAAAYLRRALAEPPPPGARAAVLLEAGSLEVLVAQLEDATPHLEEALELTVDPGAKALVITELGRAFVASGRFAEAAVRLWDAAAMAASVDRELALRLEAEAAAAGTLDLSTSNAARERLLTVASGLTGATPGERLVLGNASYWMAVSGTSADEACAVAERALAGRQLVMEATADAPVVTFLFAMLVAAERYELLGPLVELALEDARARGSAFGFALASMSRALAGLWAGSLVDAEADARAAVEVAESRFPNANGVLVHILVERGELEAADRFLADCGMHGDLPQELMFTMVLSGRGALRLAQGRIGDAVDDLRDVHARVLRWGSRTGSVATYHTLLAQALLRAGDREEAKHVAREDLKLGRTWGTGRAIGKALRVQGLVEGGERRIPLLHEAVDALSASSSRLELAHAQVELGAALRRAGRRVDSRDPLHAGLELARECGAGALSARALEELHAAGGRARNVVRSGLDALTPSERRVADMAARGMTNIDIAQALFVTRRTVETQLTSVYRKLDISGRPALADALAG